MGENEPASRRILKSRVLVSAILLAALALRIWGVGDRLPDPSLGISPLDDSVVEESDRTEMYRAWGMWEGGAKRLTLDPGTVGWPSFSFYLTLTIQVGYRSVWLATHEGANTASFVQHFAENPEGLFLAGRAVGVLIGVWSIFLLYRLGRLVTNDSTACLAAILLVFNPLHIQVSQRVSDPNLLALLFTLLLAPPLIRVSSYPGVRPLLVSAIFIGLAAGSKYVPAVFLIALFIQVFAGYRAGVFSGPSALAGRLLVGLLVAAGTFLVSSPYVLLRGSVAAAELTSQGEALTSDWVGQTSSPFSLATYILQVLPSAVTWPMYLLSALGLALAWRRRCASRILVILPVIFLLANGMLRVAQERYILAAIPILLLGSAIAVAELAGVMERVLIRGRGPATAAVIIGLLVLPVKTIAAYRSELAKPDSRHAARRWIQANLPPSEPMALDLYGPVLNSGRIERLAVTWPFYANHADAVQAAYSHTFLHGFRYYAVSGEVRRRFENDPAHFSGEIDFYSWLDRHGTDIWTSSGGGLSGPEIHILRLPNHISSLSERDSSWAASALVGCDSIRLARWCGDLATANAALGRADITGEWALRGAALANGYVRLNLLGMAGEALLAQGQTQGAVELLEGAVGEFPSEFDLLVLYGLALERSGRRGEAASQFRAALRAKPNHPARGEIITEIARLTAE